MSTYTPHLLSGSTDGKQIKVGATATPGTLIHTAVSGTDNIDEIYIYVINKDPATLLTIEWGEVTVPDGFVRKTITENDGYALIIPGLRLQNGLVVRAFAGTADSILVNGYVNRYTL